MKLNRLDYLVGGVLAALGLVFVLLVVAGDQVGARVARFYPANGSAAGCTSRIGVDFAQAMLTETVESNFHLTPDTPGQFRWEGQSLWFVPDSPLEPGSYTARLTGGQSRDQRSIRSPLTWSFSVRAPELVYLSLAGAGANELWKSGPASNTPVQLTHTQGRVYDYDVAPDGERLAYSAQNDQGGTDLWQVDRDGRQPSQLVSCGADRCSMPAWAPKGTRLAYVRQPPGNGATPRLWTVDTVTGQTAPLYQDPQVSASEPTWSPDGQWLAFFDSQATGLRVLNVQTSVAFVLPSLMGQVGGWSPDSRQLAFADIKLGGPQIATILQAADMQAQSLRVIVDTDRGWSDFGPPAWSPDGNWLAVSLKAGSSSLGKQLWLMRTDGTQAHALTNAPEYTHGSYRWDPWGKSLVFQRYNLSDSNATPEVMLWPGAGEAGLIAANAALPRWLP